MSKKYIAVDIGASSGRLIVGSLEDKLIRIKEIHRFNNSMNLVGEHFFWDTDYLFNEILKGIHLYASEETQLESIGVDTWGVDYVLVNKNGERIGPVYAYRDHRTDSSMEAMFKRISPKDIYAKTGIQFQQFNTLYQLFEHVKASKEAFDKTDCLMLIPDYLHYLLSGAKTIEFTNATSTQLFNPMMYDWDETLLGIIGINKKILPAVVKPGTILGPLKESIAGATGLKGVKVIAPATHDTGSAVASVPAIGKGFAYISSGTWSLMGIESDVSICTELARQYNFTNEGGVFDTYRVLKNIMGLWLIQEVKRHLELEYSFAELALLAEESQPLRCLINPNAIRFMNPKNMIVEIQNFCRETDQYIPKSPGELARCIFESLAYGYRLVLEELHEIQEEVINRIHIIGGGAKNVLLNQLTANITGYEVFAGPFEATAIGNLVMQMIAAGSIKDIDEARQMIQKSFKIETYQPRKNDLIEENWIKFRRLCDVK